MKRLAIVLALVVAVAAVMAYAEAAPFGREGWSWPHRTSIKVCPFGSHWSSFSRKCIRTELPQSD
jgi:hypothetical protein